MDAATLREAMTPTQITPGRAQELLPHFENAMRAANITTPDRAAMWCAQIGHESAGLRYMEEIASGAAYNGRADLGNVHPGDGPRFKGSGPIQLTGRANFRAFTAWCRAQGHSQIDFEAQPHLVRENPKWGFLAASWYWTSARPGLNTAADRRDLEAATRMINGGLNGLSDRRARYQRCLAMGTRLLPGEVTVTEKVLDYPRDQVVQDTYYNCGPASAQTIIRAETGRLVSEVDLGMELGTHKGGTDWIGQFPAVLNRHLPGAQYRSVEMPNDPPTAAQKDRLWKDLTHSIDAGHGVVANIVAPPSNYPRAVAPSTIHPAYTGGTVYHYIALMGYRDDGQRKVWVADSGFRPFGYWIGFDQLSTLIPPKGYAYSTAPVTTLTEKGPLMALTDEEQRELLEKTRRVHHELTHEFGSRFPGSTFADTIAGYLLEIDRKVEDVHAGMLPWIAGRVDTIKNALKGTK